MSNNHEREAVHCAPEVPWYPRNLQELAREGLVTIGMGGFSNPRHPGFHDKSYVTRREQFARMADDWKYGEAVPEPEYTDEETGVWRAILEHLEPLHEAHACDEYLAMLPELRHEIGMTPDKIPSLAEITSFLQPRTGFRMFPVDGLVSARDFLNALAFRVFPCTQYVRHSSNPLYTNEPDVCHEIIGHVPLFADENFANFSHQIGLASLGATDDEVMELANLYWFTVENGLVRPAGDSDSPLKPGYAKVCGAALLSSVGELEFAASGAPSVACIESGNLDAAKVDNPDFLPFSPAVCATQDYPIDTFQTLLFVADSMPDMNRQMDVYVEEKMDRPFHVELNDDYSELVEDREVNRVRTDPLWSGARY